MPRLTLHHRLFISHVLVLVLGLLSFITVRRLSLTYLFSLRLDLLEAEGILLSSTRELLIEGFEAARNTSSLLALSVGIIASATLSYWSARRINHSLLEIEQVAYRLATGHLQERVPQSQIPELARLGHSLNRMVVALEDAERRRRDMVSDLSHELRTPLTIVRGYLEDINSDRLQETPEVRDRLVQETRRLERLVNALQDLSKAESGSLPLTMQPLPLPPLLHSLCDRFSSQIAEDGPVLTLVCADDLPLAWADSDHTEQILINLLGNAIRHTATGSITLKAWSKNAQIWVSIRDTGIGLSADELPYVFDRFWRSARSRQEHRSGTGIGLTITRQLVELQGGQIQVESQLGKGTTFSFWLPRFSSSEFSSSEFGSSRFRNMST